MVVDEWLQLLAQHPVFTTPPPNVGTEEAQPGSKGISNTQRAVIRGTDLFVAVGSEVRWISLKACKDAYVQFESMRLGVASSIDETQSDYKATSRQDAIQHVPWYRVLGSALGFEIRRLVCNKSGKLLAVVGRRQVAVVTLPGPESPNRAGGKGAFAAARIDKPSDEFDGACVSCASKIIGGTAIGRRGAQAGEGRGARVADALWHSMSSSDSHLVVLLGSGVVKVFDVLADVTVAEQTIPLGSVAGVSNGFSVGRAVGLSMGGGMGGWARATLYVLMNTGQLFSLCPVLPRACMLERPWLEQLLDIAEMDIREWQAEEYESRGKVCSPVELVAARDAKEWLVNVLELEPGKALMNVTLPDAWLKPAVGQGPYLYQPEPSPVAELAYDSDASSSILDTEAEDASDVVYLDTGDVGVVAISYCDSHVELFADLEPVMARWRQPMQGTEFTLPVLATLASVDLAVAPLARGGELSDSDSAEEEPRPVGAVSLIADPLCPCSLFAMHAQGVHRIDTRKWVALLGTAMGTGTEQEKNKALGQLLALLSGGKAGSALMQRSVLCVVQTNASTEQAALPVVGGVVVDDPYLAYSIIAIVAPSKLVAAAIMLPEYTNDDNNGDDSAHDDVDEETGVLVLGDENVQYVPRLPLPVYSAPSDSDLAFQAPRLVLNEPEDAETVNEVKLSQLGTIVGQLRGHLAKVAHEHQKMEARVELQVQEHRRQCDKLREISAGFANHFKQLGEARKRLAGIQDNSSKLAVRVDQLLRLLVAHYQPTLTRSEQALSRDIGGVLGAVAGPGGVAEQVDELQERLARLMNHGEEQTGHASQAAVLTFQTMGKRHENGLSTAVERLEALKQRVALAEGAGK